MPIGTPITKHKRTEIRTEDKVIIASVQILHAPINANKKAFQVIQEKLNNM